jgi:geranylgeranyl pyrophosphate synthase
VRTGASAAHEATLEAARRLTDRRIEALAARLEADHPGGDGAVLGYALRSPGKRIRPALVLAAYQAVGGGGEAVGGVCAAVETVHTYSLVHDDLPCMDDDDRRRGRPTTHVAFGVPRATRAGWLLVPVAVEVLAGAADELGLDAAALGEMATVLLEASGIRGMVGGQWLDLAGEGRRLSLEALREVHGAKTGALIQASCELGGIAGQASPEERRALAAFGRDLGLAFQVADDVLDATATSVQLGKTAGRDAELEKSTYVAELGVEGARREAVRLAARAVEALQPADIATDSLRALAQYVVDRQS